MRALPAAGFRGVNVTIPHKEAALALADDGDATPRARSAPPTRSRSSATARIHADNTDAPGLLAALPRARPAGRDARSCSAPAAPRAPRCGRSCRPARPTSRSGTARPSAPRRSPTQLGARAVAAPGSAEIVVNCTSVGLDDPDDTFKALPLQADDLGAGSLVVDMVYRHGGTLSSKRQERKGRDVVDGLEILVAQGAASFERWTGRTAPRQAMREAVADIASP